MSLPVLCSWVSCIKVNHCYNRSSDFNRSFHSASVCMHAQWLPRGEWTFSKTRIALLLLSIGAGAVFANCWDTAQENGTPGNIQIMCCYATATIKRCPIVKSILIVRAESSLKRNTKIRPAESTWITLSIFLPATEIHLLWEASVFLPSTLIHHSVDYHQTTLAQTKRMLMLLLQKQNKKVS